MSVHFTRDGEPTDALLHKLHHASLIAGGWPSLVPALEQAFDGWVAIFSQLPGSLDTLAACSGGSAESVRAYEYGLWTGDQSLVRLRHASVGETVGSSGTEIRSSQNASDFYDGFLKRGGLECGLYGKVFNRGAHSVIVAARRSIARGAFDPRDHHRLARLAPHLERAFAVSLSLDDQRRRQAAAFAALDGSRIAFACVDRHLRVQYANTVAMVRDDGPLECVQDILRAKRRAHATQVRTAIDSVFRPDGPDRVQLFLAQDGRLTTPVSVARVSVGGGPSAGERWPGGIVVSWETRHHRQVESTTLQAAFGLTPAQARLLAALAHGERLLDYAARNKISETTAKSHLRAIFLKTGATRQVDLVRHALALSR